ncbi:MAG TPA: DNA primase [Steroidobacteraceae bacterium]|jgi:DNA primase|nr:DNA primase [Steroidobacteraceae bacterium]
MAGRIPQAFIDELIARADLVELIGARIPLKKAGREYKACCPFHNEKTPSFCVIPEKQFYHCFGCGAHGTALGFLMEYDRLPFPEAVEDLATRVGLTVPHELGSGGGAETGGDSTAPLYEILTKVSDFYHSALLRNERAQAYAGQRGLTPETVERFRIGYAADGWSEVLRRFGDNERAQTQLLASGLIIERERASGSERYYDRFRDRLMFPIRDTRGRVIAFGGRVLDQGEPKYLNSPETALFHKGKELYGLYETRLARRALKRLLVVEGYMDTVRLHQAGLTYAVATLGTATTAEHLKRAFRLVSEIVFCFDGDRAGRSAAWRALQQVLSEAREGREIRFLFLPEGEDPDSLVGREGRERFEARLDSALPLSEYLVSQLLEQADVSHADGKAHFVALARPLIDKVAPGVYRELLLERVAAAINLPAARLELWMRSPESQGKAPARDERVSPRSTHSAPRLTGRGNLVTQSISLLLHFPAAANAVTDAQREELERLTQPGVHVLRELLEQQRVSAAVTTAQTLERWRERAEYRRFCELAANDPLVPDRAAAGAELKEAVARLLGLESRRRLEVLIDKARAETLDASEKQELQTLTGALSKDS